VANQREPPVAAGVEPASALVNLWIFLLLYSIGMAIEIAAPSGIHRGCYR